MQYRLPAVIVIPHVEIIICEDLEKASSTEEVWSREILRTLSQWGLSESLPSSLL